MTGNGESPAKPNGPEDKAEDGEIVVRVYAKRWLMLGLYTLFAAIVAGQWIEYCIIANIVSRYYNVSSFAVDCTSMIFMLFYGIFIFPVTYILERIGLRLSLVLGSGLCCLGSWIKIFSVSPDRFFVTILGQCIVAIAVVMMLPLPGRVAAQWFGSKELSTATSIGVFGPQLGISAVCLLAPMIVKNHENIDDIGKDLSYMFWWVATLATISLALNALFFQDEPKLPPNETRALQKQNQVENKEGFMKPMKRLLTNQSFLILCNSYGLSVGILNVLGTLLNQLYLLHFKNGEEDAGRIALLIVLTGMFGSISFGVILDKTHKFKETAVAVYFLTLCGQILFAVAIFMEVKWMVYAAAIFLGFFMSGYMALGYDMAAEYTYPESECHSAGILNIANNVYGIVLVLILEMILENYGDIPVHVMFCGLLLLGLIMTVMTKDEQRRQDARKSALYQNVPQEEVKDKVKTESSV